LKRIAEIDRLIIFKAPTVTTDAAGQAIATFNEVYRCRAKQVQQQGSENIIADQQTATEPIAWQIRYYPGLNTTMVVEDESGQTYNVTAVTEATRKDKFYRKRWLTIKAFTTNGDQQHSI
jgi:SPP1 family predicted phage head-tail adaptor